MSLEAEAELIKLSFENMFIQWGSTTPLRTGLHASSVLVSDSEWCVREHVLGELFPDQAVKQELHSWDWKKLERFLHGWEIHRMLQHIIKNHGRVVVTRIEYGPADIRDEYELDLTHYDETRNVYFSPDAILDFGPHRYVCEIKGINQESFNELTDDLETAMKTSEIVATAYRQANLYMHLLGLKRAMLLIWNKNKPDFKVWVIQYDKEASVEYVQRIYKVKGAVINARVHGQFPQRICHSRGDDRARKCPLRECCFSERMEG